MRYMSTRGETAPMTFQDAVLAGQAADGGLLLPDGIPDVSGSLEAWRELGFVDLAFEVLKHFADDIEESDLRDLVRRSYARFDHEEITPVVRVGDLHVLELFHGPTLAFKDVALQLLGNLFEHVLAGRGQRLSILGATSGDTGSAGIAGVRDRDNIDIFVMFPQNRTSHIQELQMTTVLDDNVHCLAITGSFDDCQEIMKSIFNDLPFKERHALGAINSINCARLIAQVSYYFYAYFRVRPEGAEPVDFSVPTGNFGDVFAGYLAARMGLPVGRLILATNENDILKVFFETGRYRRGEVHRTISPSMDIQIASNFERFLYYRLDGDSERLRAFMDAFATRGEATLDDGKPIAENIVAGAADTAETLATIRRHYEAEGYLLDPHGAVGVAVAERLGLERPTICLATAHPAKFPEAIRDAVGKDVARHPALDELEHLEARFHVLPAETDRVKEYIARHAGGG